MEASALRGDAGVTLRVFGAAHHAAGFRVQLSIRTVGTVVIWGGQEVTSQHSCHVTTFLSRNAEAADSTRLSPSMSSLALSFCSRTTASRLLCRAKVPT